MVRKSNIVSVGVKGGGGMGEPSYHYNSMSWASSSEKSDMELSDEESPAPSSCSFRASSVAYFWMYSAEGKAERKSAWSDRKKTQINSDQNYLKVCWMVAGNNLRTSRYLRSTPNRFWIGWTFNFLLVLLWSVKVHGSCISIQGVDWIWVSQQLGQERFKDVGQIWGRKWQITALPAKRSK